MDKRTYFSGLNALRLYAATCVIVEHVYTIGRDFRLLPAPGPVRGLFLTGADAVTLFFTLSGFLITALLLFEQESLGQIDVARFYIRRTLRIWPAYYAVLLFGVAFMGFVGRSTDSTGLALLVGFGGPVALVGYGVGGLGLLSHFWSLGVEEWFYLAWPWLVRSARHLGWLFLALVTLRWVVLVWAFGTGQSAFYAVLVFARVDCMALGALGAWLVLRRGPVLRLLYSRPIQAVAWFALFAVTFTTVYDPLHDVLLALVVTIVLVNTATNPAPLVRLPGGIVDRLGNLTYGLYLWHPFVVYAGLSVLAPVVADTSDPRLYAFSFAGTLIIAWASYRWLESPFLALKERFRPSAPSVA